MMGSHRLALRDRIEASDRGRRLARGVGLAEVGEKPAPAIRVRAFVSAGPRCHAPARLPRRSGSAVRRLATGLGAAGSGRGRGSGTSGDQRATRLRSAAAIGSSACTRPEPHSSLPRGKLRLFFRGGGTLLLGAFKQTGCSPSPERARQPSQRRSNLSRTPERRGPSGSGGGGGSSAAATVRVGCGARAGGLPVAAPIASAATCAANSSKAA